MHFKLANMDEMKSGMVYWDDGRNSRRQPIKLQLTSDTLTLLKEEFVPSNFEENENDALNRVRQVTVCREEVGGLGLSVKGGAEHRLPVLISKIVPGQAAAKTEQLFVGDAILKINETSCEGCGHDDVVTLLKNSGNEVLLTVKHFKPASLFLNKDKHSNNNNSPDTCSPVSIPRLEKQWSIFISLPLLFAYLTRYHQGTDRLRTNAFEVVGVDNTSTGVIHCEDSHSLADWIRAITNNITALLTQMIKMTNRLLVPEEQILYMSWVQERVTPAKHWQAWKPKYVALKGSDVYFFDMPPMQTRDWIRCDTAFKVYECMFKVVKDSDLLDDRQHCCTIHTGTGEIIYLNTDSRSDLLYLEKAWYRINHISIARLKNKTFGCTWRGRLSGLTLDLEVGFSLYDSETKSYMWSYKFSRLKGSSDDGKSKLKLHFSKEGTSQIEIREVECTNLQTLLFCIHAFLSAKLASVDPAYLSNY